MILYQSCSTVDDALGHDNNNTSYEPLTPIRISYGSDALQFGELWMPESTDKATVIMLIHGGCWLSQFDYTLMDSMALDLSERGYAVWNIEYRRTEDPGGRWPGTFLDVASGLKFIEELSSQLPLKSDEIILSGHSAGGHLALWLAAHQQLDSTLDIYLDELPEIKGVVSLAGITDLETYTSPSGCGSNVVNLIGGSVDEFPERYDIASPIKLLPLDVPQILINGEADNIVPLSHINPYLQQAKSQGEDIQLKIIPNAGHFEVITPGSVAWSDIISSFEELAN
ncbi:MAG: alpha/beta hydrolase [Saprospiraceae bacterium]|nr:alpha/beta hydrolase [Saprospiraceae bacterium]